MASDPGADERLTKFLHRLLYETPGGTRFTQDSPVLTNVWTAYAAAPRSQQKLILTVERLERAGASAQRLREMLGEMRKRLKPRSKERIDLGLKAKDRDRPKIAYIPGQIAAELYFDEMMRLVLPLTPWWMHTYRRLGQRLREMQSGVQELRPGTAFQCTADAENATLSKVWRWSGVKPCSQPGPPRSRRARSKRTRSRRCRSSAAFTCAVCRWISCGWSGLRAQSGMRS